MLPTYKQYCEYCAKKKIQPLNEIAFNKLIAIKFDPIMNEFIK